MDLPQICTTFVNFCKLKTKNGIEFELNVIYVSLMDF